MTPPFGHTLWLWLGGIATAFAAFFTVKQMGRKEARQERALQDAEAEIKINETLNEMRKQEHETADKALAVVDAPGPTDPDSLSDAEYFLTFGRKRGARQG